MWPSSSSPTSCPGQGREPGGLASGGARGSQSLPPPGVQGSSGPPMRRSLEMMAVVQESSCVVGGPAVRPLWVGALWAGALRARAHVRVERPGVLHVATCWQPSPSPATADVAGLPCPTPTGVRSRLPERTGAGVRPCTCGQLLFATQVLAPGGSYSGPGLRAGWTPAEGPSLGLRLPSRPTSEARPCARVWMEPWTGSGWRPRATFLDPAAVSPGRGTHAFSG